MINFAKSPASGAGKVSEPRLMSQVTESARNLVRVAQCVFAVRAVKVYRYSSAYVTAVIMLPR